MVCVLDGKVDHGIARPLLPCNYFDMIGGISMAGRFCSPHVCHTLTSLIQTHCYYAKSAQNGHQQVHIKVSGYDAQNISRGRLYSGQQSWQDLQRNQRVRKV